ncbi:MAG: glycosyltransferase family 4 protein [Acidimicrobiales bacterium]
MNDRALDYQGGAEVYLSRLVASQRAAGHHAAVFAGEIVKRGPRRLLDLWDPAARRGLMRRIEKERPDVVHLHNVVRELSPSVFGASHPVPVVSTVHDLRSFGVPEHHFPDPRAVVDRSVLGPMARHLLRRRGVALIAVSESVAEKVRSYGFREVVVVPVPVMPPMLPTERPESCCDVVFCGRLSVDKGAAVLLDAFAAVVDRHREARLVIVGEGPERKELEAKCSRLEAHGGIRDRVVFTGWLDQEGVSAALGRARVVVVPSLPALRREGSSLTTAEAARHGRPVVTSDDPAVAEIARAVGGEVLRAGDVAALAESLDRWLSDPRAAADAGRRAQLAAVREYGADSVQVQIDGVYRRVIARSSPRRFAAARPA